MHVPAETAFATKPQLAAAMIKRAIATGVRFKWLAADSVYGVGALETVLRRAGKGYVLGVASTHFFTSWGREIAIVGTAEEIAQGLDASAWQRLSPGDGTRERVSTTLANRLAQRRIQTRTHHRVVMLAPTKPQPRDLTSKIIRNCNARVGSALDPDVGSDVGVSVSPDRLRRCFFMDRTCYIKQPSMASTASVLT